jgi:predicted RND superfamily exporter protein
MFDQPWWTDPRAVVCGWVAFISLGLLLAASRPSFVVARARVVLAAAVMVTLALSLVLLRLDPIGLDLEIDPSTEPLLPRGDPARQLYQEAVRDFGDDEVFVIAMRDDDLFTADGLARLRRITDAVARLPGVRRAESLTDVVSFRYAPDEDWLEVRPLVEEIPTDPGDLEALRRRAVEDPLYRRTLVAEDGRSAAVNVTFRKMTDRDFIASGISDTIVGIVEAERASGVTFHVAGRPHLKATVYRMMLRDLALLIPLALLAIATVLFIVFGTARGVVLPLATVGTATLWTFATLAWLDRPLNVLTTLLAPTLIAVGSVYGVHVVTRFEEELSATGSSREAALRCLSHMRLPVMIAGATTVIGFAALLLSDIPAVRELGAFSALGIASVTLLSLTALPAALTLARPRPSERGPVWTDRLAERLDSALLKVGRFGVRRATLLLCAWTLIALGAAAALPRIVIDTDYLSYFDEDEPVRVDFDAVNRLLSGAVPIYLPLRAEKPGGFREPELLAAVETLQERAGALPDVGRTQSVVDTLRVLNRALSRDDPREERIPTTRGGVAELLFLAPKGHLDRFTNVNHSRANLVVRTGAVGTSAVRALSEQLQALLDDGILPDGVKAGVTGNAILLARSADGIARSQPASVALAAAAILLLITSGLRSPKLGVVAMVPNVLPVLVFFGLLGAGVAPLSLPTSLIGSVALGIAIDDTVHLLVRYREERRAGRSPEAAVIMATRRVGRPVAITSAMLMAGFCVVALSGFATLREFGLLSALTMGICLTSDLLLLPPLLVRARV